jgi:hypothetical protein
VEPAAQTPRRTFAINSRSAANFSARLNAGRASKRVDHLVDIFRATAGYAASAKNAEKRPICSLNDALRRAAVTRSFPVDFLDKAEVTGSSPVSPTTGECRKAPQMRGFPR